MVSKERQREEYLEIAIEIEQEMARVAEPHTERKCLRSFRWWKKRGNGAERRREMLYGNSHAWQETMKIVDKHPVSSLIMAAIIKADTDNTERLKAAFPELWQETFERYNNPGGRTNAELAREKEE